MRYLFLGAGAIGTYIGGSLAASGREVAFIEQPAMAAQLTERGLIVRRGAEVAGIGRPRMFTSPAEALATGGWDVLVFALKSFDTAAGIADVVGTGLEVPTILSLQNGVDNELTLAGVVGPRRVIAGTVTSAIAKPGPGEVVEERHRGVGVALGHPLSDAIIADFNAARLSAQGFRDAASMKWSKLLTNLQGNATSAILDMSVGELFADRRLYRVEIAVLRECLAVMRSLGCKPLNLPGTPVRWLARAAEQVPQFVSQPLLSLALGASRGEKMPSFHIDLHSGRGRTEVDFLNGAVVRYGRARSVPTPVNEVLTRTLTALSEGRENVERFRRDPDALLALLAPQPNG